MTPAIDQAQQAQPRKDAPPPPRKYDVHAEPRPYLLRHGSFTADCPAGCQCPASQHSDPKMAGKFHRYRRGEIVMSRTDLVQRFGEKFEYPAGGTTVVVTDPFAPLPGEAPDSEEYKARIELIRLRAMEVLGIKPPPASPPAQQNSQSNHGNHGQGGGKQGKQS